MEAFYVSLKAKVNNEEWLATKSHHEFWTINNQALVYKLNEY